MGDIRVRGMDIGGDIRAGVELGLGLGYLKVRVERS